MSHDPQRRHPRQRALVVSGTLLVASLLLTAPAFAGQVDVSGLGSAPSHQRFIVNYRRPLDPGASWAAQTAALQRIAAGLPPVQGRALNLQVLRRLAVGPLLIHSSLPLDHAQSVLLMRHLAAEPDVASVEVDELVKPTWTPDDPQLDSQWAFADSAASINVRPAWDKASGKAVVVAVIDTGITDHPELNANILPGYDFISDAFNAGDGDGRDGDPADAGDAFAGGQSSWHGTHVTGTIAALTDNGIGVAGTAFDAKVVPVRALGKMGGYLSDIADAIVWAAGGTVDGVPDNAYPAVAINMSFGSRNPCSATYQSAMDVAVSHGSAPVIAAGNGNSDVSSFRPANCANVIAVAATTASGDRASFSNYGAGIDVAAPGQGIVSTHNSGGQQPGLPSYTSMSGTSMAAPHVVGVIALMQSVAPAALSPAAIEALLKDTARPLPGGCSEGCGAGIVDADAAVIAAAGSL